MKTISFCRKRSVFDVIRFFCPPSLIATGAVFHMVPPVALRAAAAGFPDKTGVHEGDPRVPGVPLGLRILRTARGAAVGPCDAALRVALR